jgi:hypothetical protein
MTNPPPARSVKISADERGGWSSDRPRKEGAPVRPADISVRCRVLQPSDRLRYSPGSLVVVVSPAPDEGENFAQRVAEDAGAVLSIDKVRRLLSGRVPDEELEARATELLTAAAVKRLEANESTLVVTDALRPEGREALVRAAAERKRPRHLIMLETGRDQVAEEDRGAVNELRRALDAGELGEEGVQTALRLGGGSAGEVRRILFRPPPRDE